MMRLQSGPHYSLLKTQQSNTKSTKIQFPKTIQSSPHPARLRQHSCISNAQFSSAVGSLSSSDAPGSGPQCCCYWLRGNFLTSASSVLLVPALSSAATPAPAAAPAVAPPSGAGPATLVALPLAVGVAAAFPVAFEVTALALISSPVIAAPVRLASERERV